MAEAETQLVKRNQRKNHIRKRIRKLSGLWIKISSEFGNFVITLFCYPSGAPEFTLIASEVDPSITIDCFLFASQLCIHLIDFPIIPFEPQRWQNHLFFLNLACSCPFTYNLMFTATCHHNKGYISRKANSLMASLVKPRVT